MPADFSARRWERARRRVVASAFLRVPFYRDQWAAAGRALDEPEPTPSAALPGQLHRLCPFARPFDPSREPSPWIGDGRDLRDALAVAGAPRRAPVLEVRPAILDRRTLAGGALPWGDVLPWGDALSWGGGRPYGVLLAPEARVVDEARRRALDAAALGLAAEAGRAIVVGERAALDAVLPRLEGVRVHAVQRVSLGQAVRTAQGAAAVGIAGGVAGAPVGDPAGVGAVVAHDPHLGYLAAVAPGCGRVHLLWRHLHARPFAGPGGPAVAFTALRRRRPVLVDVVPDDAGTLTTALCPEHGTPVVTSPA
ncbi:hypothetical protein GCM10010149_27590 [Nonomuraea roseoviolacea subsp. roseoviolacea]|uniref:Uncharacterized protein n=1 Tax=Nonomuraea roseoviolacea subsp. carminata TaxID=160689 RepID=A0ABT1JR02_9ACTN|nr:hypothetical protein [Nonomuraea roseoviolacea]MCP2344147.1 hypothetical protein [Nonomuraea roseoviolacea subsp. carminata]